MNLAELKNDILKTLEGKTTKEKIKEIKNRQFNLEMKDRWNYMDYNLDEVFNSILNDLEKCIEKLDDNNE